MATDRFITEYNGHMFQDDGAYCSKDFKSFATKFKNYLKRNLPSGFEIVKHSCGHYDLGGFVKNPEGKFIYYSWSWDRFSPLDMFHAHGVMGYVLYRIAKDEKDYTGGTNNFTTMADLPQEIVKLMNR